MTDYATSLLKKQLRGDSVTPSTASSSHVGHGHFQSVLNLLYCCVQNSQSTQLRAFQLVW